LQRKRLGKTFAEEVIAYHLSTYHLLHQIAIGVKYELVNNTIFVTFGKVTYYRLHKKVGRMGPTVFISNANLH